MSINTYISKAFRAFGYPMEITEKEVAFPPLNIWITGKVDFVDDSNPENVHVRLMMKTRHVALFPDGIFEYAYGWGKTEEEAGINAAYRWIESDFDTFNDLLSKDPQHDSRKSKMELLSISDGGKVLGWEAVFGDLIYTQLIAGGLQLEQNELFLRLFTLITGTLLSKKGVYGIKVFVSKKEDGSIETDCRLNCHEWEEGKKELEKYAQEWKIEGETHWRKQYIILVNKDLDEMENAAELLQELNDRLDRKFEEMKRRSR